jgi:RNA polymerase sigma factor (TIGR02999 family)
MTTPDSHAPDANTLLARLRNGDHAAAGDLFNLVYDSFRDIAAAQLSHEHRGHTLQPTALVHEAFLKLIDQQRVDWQSRTHFLAVGAEAMRRILVDHARKKKRLKRGGGRPTISLSAELAVSTRQEEDVLAVDEALEQLAKLDPRQARIVEMRFFAGMTAAEVADALSISKATVDREWRIVRAWLRQRLSDGDPL